VAVNSFATDTPAEVELVRQAAVEAGADDVTFEAGEAEIIGPVEAFKMIADGLRLAKIQPDEAGLKMLPTNEIELSVDETMQVLKVIEALEELDDVQQVFLVFCDGRLIAHRSKKKLSGGGEEIISGMLTAIQGFIKEFLLEGKR
jgi:transcriptional/translational regulatory protein YebC/TACO1